MYNRGRFDNELYYKCDRRLREFDRERDLLQAKSNNPGSIRGAAMSFWRSASTLRILRNHREQRTQGTTSPMVSGNASME